MLLLFTGSMACFTACNSTAEAETEVIEEVEVKDGKIEVETQEVEIETTAAGDTLEVEQ